MDVFLQRALDRIEQVTRGVPVDLLRRHPPGKWSAAEVLGHLTLTFISTAKLMRRHLETARPAADRPNWKQRAARWGVIGAGLFPKGRPAPEFAVPKDVVADDALPQFREALAVMDKALTQCEQQFGAAAPVASHFAFGPLTVRQWRKFHWVHTRHHAKQIENLVIR